MLNGQGGDWDITTNQNQLTFISKEDISSIDTKSRGEMSPKPDRGAKPLTSSNFYILFALADREQHGLGIAAEIAQRTDGDVELGPGTLYTAIQKMEDAGLIKESTGSRRDGKDDARRRYYRITAAGRHALQAETRRLARIVDAAFQKRILKDRTTT
jgi:DNA-binding PadR family transcriptional regulator